MDKKTQTFKLKVALELSTKDTHNHYASDVVVFTLDNTNSLLHDSESDVKDTLEEIQSRINNAYAELEIIFNHKFLKQQ